ncbi:MAG TPA: response regulator [Nitrospinota bacterium]|jgi:CheY-like chemotaxis protein|nr:response regulator [Nitrospinota bacterium]|tara:strand:- start:723 stop:1358 length:636 start_codon:yes stop_codon:yes gene_type:complete
MPKVKILVVEDSKDTFKLIQKHLKELEYAVSSFVASGEEAIKKAEEDMPDLVLMDIELEGKMDGIEAAGVIRARLDIPVVYLTAHSDEKILERAKLTEPFGYILKPFKKGELQSNIEMALYKYKVEKKLKKTNQELQDALDKVKLLSGLIPICANCKDVRDDGGNWKQVEDYIQTHSEAQFSHGICIKCTKELYPEFYDKNKDTGKQQSND